jgi:phosphoglycolate phosphatase-like HAD superfamily hydrolase
MRDILFDIDGTLADCSHRMHWVRTKPKNWKAFNAAMAKDMPHHDIIWLAKTLYAAGNRIIISSGRGEETRDVTVNWLDNNAGLQGVYCRLYMRPLNDFRSDVIVKSEMLDQMIKDGYDPYMAFDDRDGVVAGWRSRGIRCLQVAPGDF